MPDRYIPGSSTEEKAQGFDVSFRAWMDRLMRTNYAVANLVLDSADKGDFRPLESLYRGFTGKDKTTFGDVLTEMGIEPQTTPGKFGKAAAGLALDVALDPLSYVSFGGLTKIGAEAQKVGKLAPTLAERGRLGQASFVGLQAPFAQAGMPLIHGQPGLDLMTKSGEAVRGLPPIQAIGKALVPNFRPAGVDPVAWGRLTEARTLARSLEESGKADAIQFATSIRQTVDRMVKTKQIVPGQVDDILEAVERRSFGASLPPSAQDLWKKLTDYADNLAERRSAIPGKALLGEADYDHWVHTLSTQELALLRKKGWDWPFREFSTKTSSDLHREILKFTNPETGLDIVGKADELGLLPITFKGMSKEMTGELFAGHIKDLTTAQDVAKRFGFELRFGPKETIRGGALGSYTSVDLGKVAGKGTAEQFHRVIRIATGGKDMDEVVSIIAHELGHSVHGVAGEVGTLQFLKPNYKGGVYNKALTELQEAITKERDQIMKFEGYGPEVLEKMSRDFKDYLKYPTEVLARLAAMYKTDPGAMEKLAPLTTARLKTFINLDPVMAKFFGSNLPKVMSKAPIDSLANLYRDSKGNILVGHQATIREVNDSFGRRFFETDPARTAAISGMRTARQEAGALFFSHVASLGRRTGAAPSGWIELNDATQKMWKNLRGRKFDPQIAKEIEKTVAVFTQEASTKEFLKTFDRMQGIWKAWTLGPIPAYHFRNMVGNFWNNYLAGVVNPVHYARAARLQTAAVRGQLNGQERALWKLVERFGITGRGMYATEASFLNDAAKTLTERVTAIPHAAMQAGSHIEDNARIAHFLDRLSRGWRPSEAAHSVKKYLFDYGELTEFEKNVMRRLFPFYAWTRKNIPLQLESLITHPGRVLPVEKGRQELYTESGRPNLDLLPQWAKERMPAILPLAREGISYFPVESWLPYADLSKLDRPQDAVGELLTPIMKIPLELVTNKMYYFDRPIEDYPGEMEKFLRTDMPAWMAYLSRQTRVLSIANRLLGSGKEDPKGESAQPDLGLRVLREVTGIKFYQQDIAAARRRRAFEIRKELEKLSIGLARAEKAGNEAEVQRVRPKVEDLKREVRKWL